MNWSGSGGGSDDDGGGSSDDDDDDDTDESSKKFIELVLDNTTRALNPEKVRQAIPGGLHTCIPPPSSSSPQCKVLTSITDNDSGSVKALKTIGKYDDDNNNNNINNNDINNTHNYIIIINIIIIKHRSPINGES